MVISLADRAFSNPFVTVFVRPFPFFEETHDASGPRSFLLPSGPVERECIACGVVQRLEALM